MAVVISAGIVISILLCVYLSRVIGKPVALATNVANLLADGNLDIDRVMNTDDNDLLSRRDEIGDLPVLSEN